MAPDPDRRRPQSTQETVMRLSPVRILLLSPHPDDIAWSLGGTVARLRETGAALSVLTFFGHTRYAPGSAVHGTAAATLVRGVEEDAWASRTGVRLDRGDLPDASLRGYTDETEMGPQPEPDIVRAVVERLRVAVASIRPHLTFAPLAIGGHVDHRAVRLAVSATGRASGLLWYEDLPYASGAEPGYTGHPVLVDVSSRWAAKESGVRCYPSQLPGDVLPVLRAHATAVAGAVAGGRGGAARAERLWAASAEAGERLRRLIAPGVLTGGRTPPVQRAG
jgi:LmbE family N-acetylglucosaminyl deacetylase